MFIFFVSIKEEKSILFFGIQGAEGGELPIKVRCPDNDFVTDGFCLSQTGGNRRVHRGSGVLNPYGRDRSSGTAPGWLSSALVCGAAMAERGSSREICLFNGPLT